MSNADLIERLRNTPNWMREAFCDWKGCVSAYDRAPFEAADALAELHVEHGKAKIRIGELECKLSVAREALRYAGDEPNLDRARRIADAALAQIGECS